ncbi:YcaO-like family protein [Streptomyces sp. NBC_00201]|uniref:YcaO-like family protein n=1 Tax=unclassified Streptomyces TaxID=2593676 RepID=UPI002253ECEF|nr:MULTISPECIES: YcaO-like family protein [unclassified Streptomyces]MCX5063731.1 YcaO-like family protein [Streptomyces sp. NBC_00452]MCX5251886.1 YcaO-like family protein [Streptomyces sp. NBC_00201]MCX5294211.1 YcaO-like family protein [Streptomyces sp. NBC_00183]
MPTETIRLNGTVRARTPDDTWSIIAPHLPRYGITRIADLTGLDHLGLPVSTAIRPGARTLAASQGKGATDRLAAISAAMEAIELWHAEQPLPVDQYGSAQDLNPPYPLWSLPVRVPHPGLAHLPLEWTTGTGLTTGRPTPVPTRLISRAPRTMWTPDVLRATSTGLACGNTREEALLHALYEVIERDVLHTDEMRDGALRRLIRPATVDDPYARTLIDRLHQRQVLLELAAVEGPYGIPVCLAYLWSEDYPAWFAGSGCDTDPAIALTRAITEAAQSRLTCIAGTRDDLPSRDEVFDTSPPAPKAAAAATSWNQLADGPALADTFADQVQAIAGRLQDVTGYEPIAVTLSGPDDPLAAVKVIAPGARSRTRRAIPR